MLKKVRPRIIINHYETRPNQVETAVHGCNFWLSVETLVMSLSRQAFYVVISLASLLSDLWPGGVLK